MRVCVKLAGRVVVTMDSPHSSSKLDLYSIPVFLLEVVILIGLAFAAHYIHFQHKHEPYLTGFYCDDISLRHEYHDSKLTEQFTRPDNELVILGLLLVVPIVMVSVNHLGGRPDAGDPTCSFISN